MSQPPYDYPPDWCLHHERIHGPMDWGGGCRTIDDLAFEQQHEQFQQTWRQVEASERELRWWRHRAGWLKRLTVCWWKHRTRKIADGDLSRSCWACADPS